ncbi:dihydrofolate reductase [Sphingomonas aerophila]|uniref:Dihydrofolate reductase n=1 Tax=Sphingomonas aerophila TaxID=1344948 RepID=A0A7W9BBR7_9SPHN|nr:dihydrofolate reductase [Sphingomonas aerophila]
MIVFYLARADNGVVGRDGGIPWHIPGEQKRFKAMTMGKPMVMGRRTFDSFPAPLPARRHIVLTRDPAWSATGAEVAHSPEQALAMAGQGEVAVIGGAEIFALFTPDRVELTEVHCAPDGNASVPPFTGLTEVAREDRPAADGVPAYSFVSLIRG